MEREEMWYLTREVHHAKKMFSVYSNLDKKKKITLI